MIDIMHVATAPQNLTISGNPVTSSPVNQLYAGFTVSASGGNKPYTYSIQAGVLPTGITINASTGVVAGTPSLIALATGIVIRVTDFAGRTADLASFNINVTV
jgi:hypothetical protein